MLLFPKCSPYSIPNCPGNFANEEIKIELKWLIVPILAWDAPLISPIFLKRPLVFLILFSFTFLHCSFKKDLLSLLAILWNSAFIWVYLLRIPRITRKSNQPIVKEINPNIHWKDYCWSWSSNTLATWCEESSHWKRPWWWENIESRRRKGWQRIRWLDSITDSMDMIWANSGS